MRMRSFRKKATSILCLSGQVTKHEFCTLLSFRNGRSLRCCLPSRRNQHPNMQAEEASIHNNPNNICESILITIRIVRFGNRKTLNVTPTNSRLSSCVCLLCMVCRCMEDGTDKWLTPPDALCCVTAVLIRFSVFLEKYKILKL